MSSTSQLYWKSPEPEAALREALVKLDARIEELPSQRWDAKKSTIGGLSDNHLSCLAPDGGAWSSLLLALNSQLAEPLAAALSVATGTAVVAFYEFEQAVWGLQLYEQGRSVAKFWNRPDYVEEDPRSCAVDPKLLAARFGVAVEDIAAYLNHVDPNAEELGKVFPDDEFELGDHWVRCDLMRRLGLRYAEPGEPGTRHLLIRESGDVDRPPSKPRWWRRLLGNR